MRFVNLTICASVAVILAGCNQPNYNAIANRLRETNMAQEKEIASLKEQLGNETATVQMLRGQQAPPLPTLPADRLAQLFTAATMAIRTDTRVDNWTENGKRVDGFRVFIRFYTADGQMIPASGTMTIEAFELPAAPADPQRLGVWTFGPAEMKKNWYAGFGLDHFALNCAFMTRPTRRDIIFKARFVDALTGQMLQAQLSKAVDLPVAAGQ